VLSIWCCVLVRCATDVVNPDKMAVEVAIQGGRLGQHLSDEMADRDDIKAAAGESAEPAVAAEERRNVDDSDDRDVDSRTVGLSDSRTDDGAGQPRVDEPPTGDPTGESPIYEPGDPPPALSPSTGARGSLSDVEGSERNESNGPAGRVADPQLKAVIEALIFASPEPLTAKMLFKLLESEPKEDVQLALESLRADYDRPGGLQLVEVANGYQIVTRAEMHEWVRRLFHERKTQKLSVQALETLAVIAYKQPITAPEIGEIRGVNTGGVINTLLERHLVKISGRKSVVGRPFLYSTTREFLIRFGLKDLGDLPKVEDLADVLGFEPPAGLTDGPAEARLPLEAEGDGNGNGNGAGQGDAAEPSESLEEPPAGEEPEQVH
jgi:segregation and condensation protein B